MNMQTLAKYSIHSCLELGSGVKKCVTYLVITFLCQSNQDCPPQNLSQGIGLISQIFEGQFLISTFFSVHVKTKTETKNYS